MRQSFVAFFFTEWLEEGLAIIFISDDWAQVGMNELAGMLLFLKVVELANGDADQLTTIYISTSHVSPM